MAEIIIKGHQPLSGEVTIGGAKNSTVALIPASILSDSMVSFDAVPSILDVKNLQMILAAMNVPSNFEDGTLDINPVNIEESPLPAGAIKSLRASYYFMGALLGRFNRATVTFPGGDNIGPRPIDQHLKGFKALGASVVEEDDTIYLNAENGLHGAEIFFDMVSVGATMNVMMAAVRAKGQTILENVAREPEIVDLATFLNNMGAKIRGAGTDTIRITGVDSLVSKNTHTIIPDRIEAGTYMSLAASIGRGITIKNIIPEHMESFTAKFIEMGVPVEINEDSIFVPEVKDDQLKAITITTAPFPGYATDLQQPITPLLLKANGESTILETIYPKRTRHLPELRLLGANAQSPLDGVIRISQSPRLVGTKVKAAEIRAGASLVIAGLMAEGTTVIEDADHILRGYDRIQEKITALGGNIEVNGIDMINLMP